MEQDRSQRYVNSLEKVLQNHYRYLKETAEDFQEMCRVVTPEKQTPPAILNDIREMYKELRNRITEFKAIEQLLLGKYRQYYRRDPMRDKEILEIGFIVKNGYSKIEFIILQQEAKKKIKEGLPKPETLKGPFQWFRSNENQVALVNNLRMLSELDYEPAPPEGGQDKRDLLGNRHFTLFFIGGSAPILDQVQSRIQLREHDIIERYAPEEIRGALVHLKKIDPPEVKRVFQKLLEAGDFKKLKCLLLPIYSRKDLEEDQLRFIPVTLKKMTEGELKIFSI